MSSMSSKSSKSNNAMNSRNDMNNSKNSSGFLYPPPPNSYSLNFSVLGVSRLCANRLKGAQHRGD